MSTTPFSYSLTQTPSRSPTAWSPNQKACLTPSSSRSNWQPGPWTMPPTSPSPPAASARPTATDFLEGCAENGSVRTSLGN